MQPRLKSSKKWSPLPDELIKQIRSIFTQNFKEHTQGGKIEASGRIYPEEILIAVGFKAKDSGLRQINWEVSISYVKNKDNVMKLLHTGVDVVGALFDQSFTTEDDHEFPRIWQAVDFDGQQVYIQYTTVNTELESAADRLLGVKKGDDLEVAQGAWDDDDELVDPAVIKATLGIDPNDAELLGDEDETKDEEEALESKKKAPKTKGPRKPPAH